MKMQRWTVWLLTGLLPLMSGCAGFWDAPTSSSSTVSSTTLSSGYFFVLNIETNQIVSYYVKAGTLTQVASYTTPTTPITLAVAPNNEYLYLSTVGGIYVYSISSGNLTITNSASVISSDEAYTMQVSANNAWLIEAVSGTAAVNAIPLSTSTGLPSSSTEEAVGISSSNIEQLTISPDDDYVFVAMGSGGTACIPFTTGNTNPFGSVSTISTVSTSGAALSVAVDPDDRLLYIGETSATSSSNSGGLRVFKYSTLTELSGSPYATGGLAPYSILPEAGGEYVYVANRQTNSSSTGLIEGYTISSSSSTYTLASMSSNFTAGTHTVGLVEDSSDQFIFAVSIGGSYDLTGYVFDSTTAGSLDTVLESSTGTDPVEAGAIAAIH
ncbi:beta-propeller fold lactonase family protein [Telmatobacter bradus]|uniref:beta-propeller fold lactonase family protein n=1 Tax=Telmatobacter bradus TaxID=474953 RepID=UPI003B4291F4